MVTYRILLRDYGSKESKTGLDNYHLSNIK